MLLVPLQSKEVDALFQEVLASPGIKISADLEKQVVTSPSGKEYHFKINAFAKTCLLNGLDQIAWTLQFEKQITAHEEKIQSLWPWLI